MVFDSIDWLPPSPQALAEKRLDWFKNEREAAAREGRKARPCALKTRAQLLELWRKRIERLGNNEVYVGVRARARGVRVQVESVCTHSRGSESVSSQAGVVTATPTASTPAVIEACVKPAWVLKAEQDVANIEFVGFEGGEPVFRLRRAGKRMTFADGEFAEVSRLRPVGFKNKRIEKIEKEENWFLVGWDSGEMEVFVERS
jgi:hypothetical protein